VGSPLAADQGRPTEATQKGDQAKNTKARKSAVRVTNKKLSTKKSEPKKTEPKKSESKKYSLGRERLALKFVKEHHAELGGLLSGLKSNNEKQYRAAVVDLIRDRERLLKIEERDSERHELALELWKLNSRLRLEVARFSIVESAGDVSKLAELMKKRNNVRIKAFLLDRKRLAERAEKLDKQIDDLKSQTDEGFVKDIQRLRKSVAAQARAAAKAERTRTVTTKPDAKRNKSISD
jgi:Rad3-related DNA helicase